MEQQQQHIPILAIFQYQMSLPAVAAYGSASSSSAASDDSALHKKLQLLAICDRIRIKVQVQDLFDQVMANEAEREKGNTIKLPEVSKECVVKLKGIVNEWHTFAIHSHYKLDLAEQVWAANEFVLLLVNTLLQGQWRCPDHETNVTRIVTILEQRLL